MNPGQLLRKHMKYPDVECEAPGDETLSALLQLVRYWSTSSHARTRSEKESLRIFWSLQAFWSKTPGALEEDMSCALSYPKDDDEIVQLKELHESLQKTGHQVYLSVYAAIVHGKKDVVSEETLVTWDKAMSQFVSLGATSGILVDRGNGFWNEHLTFWNQERWFCVSEDEEVLSQVIDRYTMRQKAMLQLQIGRVPFKKFVDLELVAIAAVQLSKTPWPSAASYEVDADFEHVYDVDDDEEDEDDGETF
jgi:hypothetical protein